MSIPYTGDHQLWDLKPNQWKASFPVARYTAPNRGGVGNLYIQITERADQPQQRIKDQLEGTLSDVRFYLRAQDKQIEAHNEPLQRTIDDAIQARKERLRAQDGIADFLGIPLKRCGDAPSIDAIPIKRKLVKPLPTSPGSEFKPEPGIADEEFEYILSVIRHEGRTFESLAKTFALHGEESLRDIILAHLNGHYKGGATGETFRRQGKTDIRIESENRAAFVAECKVWKGSKGIGEAIDQLLGYLTWRDCKIAMIVFNKHNTQFSQIMEKLPAAFREHQAFSGELSGYVDGEWRFRLQLPDDESRFVIVHVYVFDLFIR